MKIFLSNMESLYSNVSGNSKTSIKRSSATEQETEMNKVDISEASLFHDELDDIKAVAVQETEKGTDPDRLRQLRTEITNGTYSVSSSDIAGAMLKISENEN